MYPPVPKTLKLVPKTSVLVTDKLPKIVNGDIGFL
jgi:hypothetical protein